MPETNENPNPVSLSTKKRNERTEAKFFEDADKIIAEAERLGAEYNPPNDIAKLSHLIPQRDASVAARTANQSTNADEENERNIRENLYKTLNSDVTGMIGYAKSYGIPENQLATLEAIARDIKGQRAAPIDPADGATHISVANLSYVTRADNFARIIAQYETLQIPATEDQFKVATYRTKLDALRAANNSVINAEAASNNAGEQFDNLAYLNADSLMDGCISAKAYIKSKFKASGQPYKNIAKTRFELPTRLRKKKK